MLWSYIIFSHGPDQNYKQFNKQIYEKDIKQILFFSSSIMFLPIRLWRKSKVIDCGLKNRSSLRRRPFIVVTSQTRNNLLNSSKTKAGVASRKLISKHLTKVVFPRAWNRKKGRVGYEGCLLFVRHFFFSFVCYRFLVILWWDFFQNSFSV